MNPSFVLIIALLFVGILLRRIKEFPGNTASVLNKMVIWVALPAVIFKQVPHLKLDSTVLIPAITPWMIILVTAGLVYISGRIFKIPEKTLGALLLIVPLGNTSFLGFPAIEALRGVESVAYAVIYDQLGSFLGLGIYGILIVSLFASKDKPTFTSVIKKVFLFPPFISLIAAFIFSSFFNWNSHFEKALSVVGGTLVPMAMIAVGFQLKIRLPKKSYTYLVFGLFTKLLLAPLIVFFVFSILDIHSEAAKVSILESGMPPMITAGAMAIDSGMDEELTVGMIGIGIFTSLFTLPLLNSFI